MDQFLLFGDSITQHCFNQDAGFAFGAALSEIYVRRLDVVNRGMSGYNSKQAFQALPLIMPDPAHARVRIMTIFFGANDARIAGTPGGPDQHVPLDEFVENIRAIIQHPVVRRHEGIRIILVMTPPVDERTCLKHDLERYPGMGRVLRRTAANTARYAQAVRTLGDELGLPVLDIHGAMLARAGYNSSTASTPAVTPSSTASTSTTGLSPQPGPFSGAASALVATPSPTDEMPGGPLDAPPLVGSLRAPPSPALQAFLHDGLHFSGDGYRLLYGELMALIEEHFPDQMPTRLPFVLPAWDDEKAWGGTGPEFWEALDG